MTAGQADELHQRRVIGFIAGEPVIGHITWDKVSGAENRYQASATLNGLSLACDGECIYFDFELANGLTLTALALIANLWQAGAIRQLATLAETWCNSNLDA